MKKKLVTLILALLMVFVLTSCGGTSTEETDTSDLNAEGIPEFAYDNAFTINIPSGFGKEEDSTNDYFVGPNDVQIVLSAENVEGILENDVLWDDANYREWDKGGNLAVSEPWHNDYFQGMKYAGPTDDPEQYPSFELVVFVIDDKVYRVVVLGNYDNEVFDTSSFFDSIKSF